MFGKSRQIEERVRDLELKSSAAEAVSANWKSAHDDLMAAHRSLLDAHQELEERLENKQRALDKALDELAQAQLHIQTQPRMMGAVPMHVSEDEEEARWQMENGMIDKPMYDAILKEIGFQNSEVDFAT